jgi:hypothetical protein
MKIVNLILQSKLSEAKDCIVEKLNTILEQKLVEYKKYVAESVYVFEEENLDEAVKRSTNIVKMGRVQRIRRRIRRNKQGRIVVQRNRRRSAVKGFRVSGNKLKRITAVQRINKTRKLKRYWKAKGRATLQRRKLKQKMSMRRRKSMGIR